jgi:hypothetical protein
MSQHIQDNVRLLFGAPLNHGPALLLRSGRFLGTAGGGHG